MKHNNRIKRSSIFIYLFYLLVVIIILKDVLVSPGGIYLNIDWPIQPFPEQIEERAGHIFYSWDEFANLGWRFTSINDFAFWIILVLFAFLKISPDILTKALPILLLSLAPFTMYFFLSKKGLGSIPSFLGGLLYILNPFIFSRFVLGYLTAIIAYALLPIIIYKIDRYISGNGSVRDLLVLGLIFGLALNATYFIVFFMFIIIYLSFYYIIHNDVFTFSINFSMIRKYFNLFFIIIMTFFLLNSFWVFPLLKTSFENKQVVLQSEETVNYKANIYSIALTSKNMIDIMRLTSEQSGGYFFTPYIKDKPVWMFSSFLLLVLIFMVPLLYPKKRYLYMFFGVALISVFFGKGSTAPFGFIYPFLYQKMSYLTNDPYRLLAISTFSYSILFGYSSQWIFDKVKNARRVWKIRYINTAIKGICVILFIGVLIGYTFPLFFTAMHDNVKTYKFDESYQKLYYAFMNDPEQYRVTWFPSSSPIDYPGGGHSAWDPLSTYSGKPSYVVTHSYDKPSFFLKFITINAYLPRTKYLADLLQIPNVRYIVDNNISGGNIPVRDYKNIIFSEKIENQEDLVNKFSGDRYNLYKNIRESSPFFISKENILISGGYSSLVSLSYADRRNFNETTFLFTTSKLKKNESDRIIDSILVEDYDFHDLFFYFLPSSNIHHIGAYAANSPYPPWKDWGNLHGWWFDEQLVNVGGSVFELLSSLDNIAFTLSDKELDVPIMVSSDGVYDIFLKYFKGVSGSGVDVFLGNKSIGYLDTNSGKNIGFQWIQLNKVSLESGVKQIRFKNDGKGRAAIAKIVISLHNETLKAYDEMIEFVQDKKLYNLIEAEHIVSLPASNLRNIDYNSSQGYVVGISGEVNFPIYVLRNSTYSIRLRLFSEKKNMLEIGIGKADFNGTYSLDEGWSWVNISDLELAAGNDIISISGGDDVFLDLIYIESDDIIEDRSDSSISFTKINPTRYKVNVENENPMLVIFNSAYSKYWELNFEERVYDPIEIDSLFNGYYILPEKEGYLQFSVQRIWRIGLAMSIISFILIIGLLIRKRKEVIK